MTVKKAENFSAFLLNKKTNEAAYTPLDLKRDVVDFMLADFIKVLTIWFEASIQEYDFIKLYFWGISTMKCEKCIYFKSGIRLDGRKKGVGFGFVSIDGHVLAGLILHLTFYIEV